MGVGFVFCVFFLLSPTPRHPPSPLPHLVFGRLQVGKHLRRQLRQPPAPQQVVLLDEHFPQPRLAERVVLEVEPVEAGAVEGWAWWRVKCHPRAGGGDHKHTQKTSRRAHSPPPPRRHAAAPDQKRKTHRWNVFLSACMSRASTFNSWLVSRSDSKTSARVRYLPSRKMTTWGGKGRRGRGWGLGRGLHGGHTRQSLFGPRAAGQPRNAGGATHPPTRPPPPPQNTPAPPRPHLVRLLAQLGFNKPQEVLLVHARRVVDVGVDFAHVVKVAVRRACGRGEGASGGAWPRAAP